MLLLLVLVARGEAEIGFHNPMLSACTTEGLCVSIMPKIKISIISVDN